jgi:catechol 2,3-dioxygenase-like lactoylglutathione lyase family enzyme
MKINSISGVTYLVADLDKTAAFYETLGFRMGKREEDRLTCYVNWFSVTFVVEDGAHPHKGTGVLLHLKVDDIDGYHSAVLELGFTPASEPTKTAPGRREFVLKDPDGYELVFFAKK